MIKVQLQTIARCQKENACFYDDDNDKFVPYEVNLTHNIDSLFFMSHKEQTACYAEFISQGCQDTFQGFISMLGTDLFNFETFKPVEVGGNIYMVKSSRSK